MSDLSRTRITFFVIIGIAVVAIMCVGLFTVFRSLATGNNNQSDIANTAEDEVASTSLPADTIVVTLESSNTKQNWVDQVVAKFNSEQHQTAAGNLIVVQVKHGTSGDAMNAILDGTLQPTAWSPGDQSWVEQANQTWRDRTNKPLASQTCQPTVLAPIGFAMWQPMAETLGWPEQPIGWDTIVELAADPNGWATHNRPEWGLFRFGHTHPAYANSGLLAMTSFVYGIAGQAETLTAAQVYDPAIEEAMRTLARNTAKYGRQAPALLELMAQEGPSYLHAAAVPEAEAIRFNVERGSELAFPLAFIFPSGGTIWADHPYCILDNADWVSDEQAEGAQIFLDFLHERTQQEMAMDNYLRPLDTDIPLRDPFTLANGTDPNASPATIPALPSPDAQLSEAIIDLFQLTKRKATVVLVLDVSGSMEGDPIRTATEATAEFLSRLDPNDEVAILIFNDTVVTLAEPSRVGDVVEGLAARVTTLVAGGNTALYDAVCTASELVNSQRQEDIQNGETRLYGIVLLSDGEDTVGRVSEGLMFSTCLPANAEADGVKIYPIAFGASADESVLSRMARVTGGRLFTADAASISNVYISISAEQ
ncbi:MAG: VWA domain-containing protein [Chloroflexi bacterium]|nr:VWA domain-containing protein [Chloroflexota bacterium]MBP8056414.1 VWA domain-containing protein [Chloroflexota bacterium]